MRAVDRMNELDLQVFRDCLYAAVRGPFFDDEEFHTLIGFDRSEIANILAA